jgi:predicted nucleic acid-binding protein
MGARYLFDTGFLTLALTNSLPEKWTRPWIETRKRRKRAYIIEPVIAETYYQLMRKGISKEGAKSYVMNVKMLESLNVISLDNNDSLRAGSYHLRFSNLSLVDCFLLRVALKRKLKIYTTDNALRAAAKVIKVMCDYLPI